MSCSDGLTTGQQTGSRFSVLPARQFSVALGSYNVAKVRLPGQTDRARPEQPDIPGLQVSEQDAGMGQIRLALMKMGCRVNVDATNAVSCVDVADARYVPRALCLGISSPLWVTRSTETTMGTTWTVSGLLICAHIASTLTTVKSTCSSITTH